MKHTARRLILASALVALACGGGGSSTTPTPPVVTAPPSTTLAAKPTPSPTPSLDPNAPVIAGQCVLPPQEPNDHCAAAKHGPDFQGEIRNAVAKVQETKPNFFDGKIITQPEKYMALLVEILQTEQNVCAVRKADEVWVKNSNKYSEHYDMMAGDKNGNQTLNWSYVTTCTPAAF